MYMKDLMQSSTRLSGNRKISSIPRTGGRIMKEIEQTVSKKELRPSRGNFHLHLLEE